MEEQQEDTKSLTKVDLQWSNRAALGVVTARVRYVPCGS